MAKMQSVEVVLPLAVELELEEHWIRETEKAGKEIDARVLNFNRRTRNILTPVKVELPAPDELRRQYKEKCQVAKQDLSLTVIPLSGRPLAAVYELAVKLVPPFEEKGVGFKDAVILLSVLDHLEAEVGREGALITQDQIFEKAPIAELCPSVTGRIQVYKELKEVYAILLDRLAGKYFDAWQVDRREIKTLLEQKRAELNEFIETNLEVYAFDLPPAVKLVKSIEVADLQDDTIQAPIPRPAKSQEVPISFEVDVKLHIVVIRFPSIPQRPLRVGQAPQVSAAILAGPRQEEETVGKTVRVEAVATFDNGYKDIRFLSVALKPLGLGLGLLGLGQDR